MPVEIIFNTDSVTTRVAVVVDDAVVVDVSELHVTGKNDAIVSCVTGRR